MTKAKYLLIYNRGAMTKTEAEQAEVSMAWSVSLGLAVLNPGNPIDLNLVVKSEGSAETGGQGESDLEFVRKRRDLRDHSSMSPGIANCREKCRLPRLRPWLISLLLAMSAPVFGCGVDSNPPVPEGWRLLDLDRAFCFAAPSSVRTIAGQAVDSLSATLRDERIEIFYDYGWYSSPLTEFADQLSSSRNGTLDGKEARFIETPELVAVHVPVVVDQTRFTMVVRFAAPEDRDLGNAVIASVRFNSK